jgi:hypothetical protein
VSHPTCLLLVWRNTSTALAVIPGRPFHTSLPQPAEGNPEQLIEAIQFGPGLVPLEDGELLAKSDGFQGEFVTWQKKRPQVSHHRTGKGNHGSILVEGRPVSNR